MTKGATLAQVAIAALAAQERSKACNWLQCSIRNIRRKLANDTFRRTKAIELLRSNARDFAQLAGRGYSENDLNDCADVLCDHILATE